MYDILKFKIKPGCSRTQSFILSLGHVSAFLHRFHRRVTICNNQRIVRETNNDRSNRQQQAKHKRVVQNVLLEWTKPSSGKLRARLPRLSEHPCRRRTDAAPFHWDTSPRSVRNMVENPFILTQRSLFLITWC